MELNKGGKNVCLEVLKSSGWGNILGHHSSLLIPWKSNCAALKHFFSLSLISWEIQPNIGFSEDDSVFFLLKILGRALMNHYVLVEICFAIVSQAMWYSCHNLDC